MRSFMRKEYRLLPSFDPGDLINMETAPWPDEIGEKEIPHSSLSTEAQSKSCITHHAACDCREFRHQQIEQAAVELAGAVWRLSEKGFIGTFDDYDEAECAHLKEIADRAVDTIRALTTGEKT